MNEISVSVSALVAPEEERDGAGTGMASDSGTDTVDENIAHKLFELGFDDLGYSLGILKTSGIAHIAFIAVVFSVVSVYIHHFGDSLDNTLLGTYFFSGNELSVYVNIEKRTDAEQTADSACGLGYAAAFYEEGEVGGEEPMMYSETVIFCPICQLVKAESFVALVCKLIHKQTVS